MSSSCTDYRHVQLYHIIILLIMPLLSLADRFSDDISSNIDPKIGTLSFFSKPRRNNFINVTKEYLDEIMNIFGTNGTMNSRQFAHMIEEFKTHSHRNLHSAKSHSNGDESVTHNVKTTNYQLYNASETTLENPQFIKCMNSSSLLFLYNFSIDCNITRDDLLLLSPAILHQLYTCKTVPVGNQKYNKSAEAWGFGFLFVTLINLCALCGVVVLPVMNTRVYKKVLLFLVALAVGSLAGSGLLVLIPEAFELVGTQEDRHGYLWMSTTIMGGVYLFFLIERFLKSAFEWKKNNNDDDEAEYSMIMDKNKNRQISCVEENPNISDIVCSVKSKTPVDNDTAKLKDPSNYHASASQCTSSLGRTNSSEFLDIQVKTETNCNDNSRGDYNDCIIKTNKKKPIKTVAWMIIFGDALHNFIDGLSIGAAFSSSVMTGISVSLAVICEELPHELGDFAILLNSGMTLKRALLFNFLSACMCYVGLIFGIVLAEVTAAHTWIFGVAGGMFLYISLVDMMPEMNQVVEAKENQDVGKMQLFILQNIGMIIGFSVILLISYYAEDINIIT
ncbi:metal cation symporter ZIP8 [Octopus bimaculoides]|uniref:Zinc transporter ZIP14 n=1 Tax=Octopus bimaculoides TaxID=37653 RepID=A0A0L8G579_OCTBM|nr:metal cation symporter ZIP8 [Octopus bimaculoides]|eukprot:XP_014784074.1 PREDICTED: zinc transporter ZIP8-like [Octopus bimaculoides]